MIRNLILYTFLFFSFGCFSQKLIPDKAEMCKILKEMRDGDRLYRKGDIIDTFAKTESNYSRREIDSVWTLQWEIDNRNTEKLIALTKEYGWISDERIACPQLDIWLIFRHSQRKYADEISELVEKEHDSGRLDDFQYEQIIHQLNGRPRGKN